MPIVTEGLGPEGTCFPAIKPVSIPLSFHIVLVAANQIREPEEEKARPPSTYRLREFVRPATYGRAIADLICWVALRPYHEGRTILSVCWIRQNRTGSRAVGWAAWGGSPLHAWGRRAVAERKIMAPYLWPQNIAKNCVFKPISRTAGSATSAN